jgi:hypothetical protein
MIVASTPTNARDSHVIFDFLFTFWLVLLVGVSDIAAFRRNLPMVERSGEDVRSYVPNFPNITISKSITNSMVS